MIRAVIFDFDGVILESADIKTEAFKELFSGYSQHLARIINYHLLNAGISRYVKFRYIYERILGEQLSGDKEAELGRRFSQLVLRKVLQAPFVAGAEGFLQKTKNRYRIFIASGTPQEELVNIIDARGLGKYFKEIHGSPEKKTDIINDIMDRYGFSSNEIVYVGDARSDRIAAEKAQVPFIERRSSLDTDSEKSPWVMRDLSGLAELLIKIGSEGSLTSCR